MNLYIENEVSLRELDSRILLAIYAATKGFNAFIAHRADINNQFFKKNLSPGIIHLKDANNSPKQLKIYKRSFPTLFLV